jgi:hypothetical protein
VGTVIHRQPFVESASKVCASSGREIVLRPRQLVLWVAVAAPDVDRLPSAVLQFPAILDTGFNGGFLIQEQHLIEWAGIQPDQLEWVDSIRIFDRHVRMREANVWLFPSSPAGSVPSGDLPAKCLELDQGIAVSPPDLDRPRLPLVGMHLLERNRLQVLIDGRRRVFSIRT